MNSAKPIAALLWEQWQMTRVELGQRLGFALVAGAGALLLSDKGPIIAFAILLLTFSVVWLSIAKLSGGRLSDGYRPGFPLPLHFTRPVPTTVFVGVAVLYNAVSITASYLLCAGLLAFAFGQPLPLFSMTLPLFFWHFCYTCAQWSTRSRVVQWVGSLVFGLPIAFFMQHQMSLPLRIEFSIVENVAMVLLCVVTFALTIVGVARQRRGDAVAMVPQQKEWTGGFPDWLVTLIRFRCPTSSATRAQVWFELRSSGLPVLMIGLGMASLILLLSSISLMFVLPRVAILPLSIVASLLVLLGLGNNALGIRRKQGRVYASAFEMTQPYGTSQLAGLKVLVRVACVLVAMLAIGASLWVSSAMVGDWFQTVLNNNGNPEVLLKLRQKFAEIFGALSWYAYAGLAVIPAIVITAVVAWQAAREALRARYPRTLLVVQWLPAVWGLMTILLTLAQRGERIPVSVLQGFLSACFWISGATFLIAAIYLAWRGLAQRSLTLRYLCGACVLAAVFAGAWLLGMPATSLTGILWPVLLILALGLLAPWSLNRVRHV